MPYTKTSELPDAIRKLPSHAQDIYMSTFNSAFKQYNGDEGKASATAWAAVEKQYKKKGDTWVAKESNMIGTLKSKQAEIVLEIGKRNASTDSVRLKKIMELCQELLSSEPVEDAKVTEAIKEADNVLVWLREQAVVKIEDGASYPAAAYAFASDAATPAGWKLRLWEDPEKKVTRAQLGRAVAALSPGGLKGKTVAIAKEDLSAVKRRIRAEYRKLEVADEDIPRWVQEATDRTLLGSFVSLSEATISKGVAEITVIRPGFNASKERYYPAEVLARDYKVFEGLKMYADHPTDEEDKTRPERSIKDWVATLKNVYVTEKGEVKGTAQIVEAWLRDKLAALKDKGMLAEMGISINAVGTAVKGEIEGVKTSILERIVRGRSVDFVTEPGAGGIVEMYEANTNDIDLISFEILTERRPDLVKQVESALKTEITTEVKKTVVLEDKIKELEDTIANLTTERDDLKGKMTEADTAQKKAAAKSVIDEAISKSELPDPSKVRLTERFKDAEAPDGVEEAIKAESEYVKSLTESKVKGFGEKHEDPEANKKAMTESVKRLHPEYSDAQVEVFLRGM